MVNGGGNWVGMVDWSGGLGIMVWGMGWCGGWVGLGMHSTSNSLTTSFSTNTFHMPTTKHVIHKSRYNIRLITYFH